MGQREGGTQIEHLYQIIRSHQSINTPDILNISVSNISIYRFCCIVMDCYKVLYYLECDQIGLIFR